MYSSQNLTEFHLDFPLAQDTQEQTSKSKSKEIKNFWMK